jgi:hypothetical protein
MTNVKISAKGKELLRDRNLSKAMLKAIGSQSQAFNSKGGVTVAVEGKVITLKNASVAMEADSQHKAD